MGQREVPGLGGRMKRREDRRSEKVRSWPGIGSFVDRDKRGWEERELGRFLGFLVDGVL